jgi:alpha/beta superfamily hydrolase
MALLLLHQPRQSPVATRGRLSGQRLVFIGALALGTIHAFDDAVVHRGPGVDLSQHALALLISIGVVASSTAAFGKLRPGVRSMLSLALGAPALANGAMHVRHISSDGFSGGDYTGVVALVAGLALIGLAAWIPWHHRGQGAPTKKARWTRRAIGVPAGLVGFLVLIFPVSFAIVEVHKGRGDIPDPPDASYAEVSFDAADGKRIAGWYRPSRNGAGVIVLHGGGGDRTGAMLHAKMLARNGYGVLVFDARGRGESEGTANSYGWEWEKDAHGALDFMLSRPDIQDGRVGALGLSSGADTMVQLAAERSDLRATVADGAAMRTYQDVHDVYGLDAAAAVMVPEFAAIRALTGMEHGPSLQSLVARIANPLLLVSAGAAEERFNHGFKAAGGPNTLLWELPDGHHTGTLRERPAEYEQRVVGFLDGALRAPRWSAARRRPAAGRP